MNTLIKHTCKECGEEFETERSLHAHIKKHKISLADYYEKHYPRTNLLTKKKLKFKDKQSYFSRDFNNRAEMIKWLDSCDLKEGHDWIYKTLKERIISKKLKMFPSHVELVTSECPDYHHIEKFRVSIRDICSELDIKNNYLTEKNLKKDVIKNPLIFIDTREQKPLKFPNSKVNKLAVGDYTLGGDLYSYSYVDRKSEGDFKSTMSQGYERFKREVEKVKALDSFLFVVVESSIDKIIENNFKQSWGSKQCTYIFHNMRELIQEYPENIQFIFTGSRSKSEGLIPTLLQIGKDISDLDIQYYLEKKGFI